MSADASGAAATSGRPIQRQRFLCFQTVSKRVKTTVNGKTVYHVQNVRQKRKMIMPTTITGQNGAVMEQATKIAVEGCAKPKSKVSRAKGRRPGVSKGG